MKVQFLGGQTQFVLGPEIQNLYFFYLLYRESKNVLQKIPLYRKYPFQAKLSSLI